MRVVSGGQTGVDRAALDAARRLGLACGGWCPAGRWAEDGPIPELYPLWETASREPAVRTTRNVRDSDATLILSPRPLRGGTAQTRQAAERLGRPFLVADPFTDAPDEALAWLKATRPATLNVAGPRESGVPGIYGAALGFLLPLLAP